MGRLSVFNIYFFFSPFPSTMLCTTRSLIVIVRWDLNIEKGRVGVTHFITFPAISVLDCRSVLSHTVERLIMITGFLFLYYSL